MSTFTGILLDVSASMQSSIGDGIDVEGGTWAQSIFTVINDLVEHDVSESNRVFAAGFGANESCEIFDTIGTIKEIQDIESRDRTPASLSTIGEIFRILEANGATNIRKWASKEIVSNIVGDHKAQLILRKLKSDYQFPRRFVRECLPPACRDLNETLPVPFLGLFQSIATSAVTCFKQASVQDVEEIVTKAMPLIKADIKIEKLSTESVFSVKQAARIIRGCTGERDLSKRRARELLKAVEPYIYGSTPLFSALREAHALFSESQSLYPDHDRLLFVLSDGEPNDEGDLNALRLMLREAKITVVCCYIARGSNIEPRTLHSVEGLDWEEGASFLFKLSSTIATQLVTRAIFIKQEWNIDITNNETRLFMHVNHPDHLREACKLARNIVCSQDALTDMLSSVSLDIYINQKNTDFKAQNQVGGTCYANASAAVLHLAMHRVVGRTGGYPDFEKLRDDLINKNGFEGANTFEVLRKVCPDYRLRCKEVNYKDAMKAVAEKRPVVAKFRLTTDNEWERFRSFYRRNPTGILRKDDLDIRRRCDVDAPTSGHAVVLTSYNSECLYLMNSWGEEWADNGFFRIENADILGLQFIDVFWRTNDLYREEQEHFRFHGSEVAEKLMRSLKGLQVAEYECPLCMMKSKVTSFDGSWSRAICPRCNGEFSCKDGEGNILALNVYLTSLSR